MSRPDFASGLMRAFTPQVFRFAVAILVTGSTWAVGGAQQPALVQRDVQAHLRAGEFGPARALAEQVPIGPQRDALWRQIAAAQADAGARRSSLLTAAQIGDDRTRSGALSEIASRPWGLLGGARRGGGTEADFDTLIDLITSTIAPDTWDLVGGPGAIDGFPGGVYVDAEGVVRRTVRDVAGHGAETAQLDRARQAAAHRGHNRDVRHPAALRKVSLPRLEKQVQLLWAAGREPDAAMRVLAGLRKIDQVFVYPQTGDVVLAGPAGDWQTDREGRRVSVETGRPVLHLDDFIVLLRNAIAEDGRFGCSITPTQQKLAATKAFLAQSTRQPLPPGQRQRDKWLDQLRQQLGNQEISVYGIDPRTRAARVIVEADYRMKLVGMGLEDGTLGVDSYLDRIQVPPGAAPPPLSVLRWWFTLNYDAVRATPGRDAFQLRGQGVKVLSENEMLTAQGKRVHTGQSDVLNREFAHDFTSHFAGLAKKYPIYAELQNVFDLALVAALLRYEDLPSQADWHLTHFGVGGRYQVGVGPAPREVPTVINHRLIHQKHIVAGVSGGVTVRTRPFVQSQAIEVADYGLLKAQREEGSAPDDLLPGQWWWD